MDMTVWNPFREMENMLERYNQATRRGISTLGLDTDIGFTEWAPTVDIEENDDNFMIKADLPGVTKDDIDIRLENGVLSISGEKRVEKETGKGTKHHRTERFHGSFSRRFTLPSEIDADHVNADYKDGVLSLTVPKIEEEKRKAIEIKVH
ncbi:MAG: Hsp20/alpha crystallin family protein [Gammaproteobacteria bacterium]|nr:Hsp20/alpha crystallin family protein [Gammaproteobacteria bacterium]